MPNPARRPRRVVLAAALAAALAACGRAASPVDHEPPGPTPEVTAVVANTQPVTKGDEPGGKRVADQEQQFREIGGEVDGQHGKDATGAVDTTPPARGSYGLDDKQTEDGRKLIRTGRVEIVVASYDTARAKIDALLAKAGGYVDSTQVDRRQDAVTDATIVVRLPSAQLPGLVPALRQLGEIVSESTNAADITDQYIDLSARLASDQALEKRLLELAADRNGNIDQLLAVERELARVREEIEGYQGHLRQWNDQVAMSTLTLAITTRRPEIAATEAPTFGDRVAHTWHASIATLEDTGTWIAVHALAALPWLLLIAPALVLLRRLARRVPVPFVIVRRAAAAPAPAAAPAAPPASTDDRA